MPNPLKEYENWKKRYEQAKKKGDEIMMGLCKRWIEKFKKEIKERMEGN